MKNRFVFISRHVPHSALPIWCVGACLLFYPKSLVGRKKIEANFFIFFSIIFIFVRKRGNDGHRLFWYLPSNERIRCCCCLFLFFVWSPKPDGLSQFRRWWVSFRYENSFQCWRSSFLIRPWIPFMWGNKIVDIRISWELMKVSCRRQKKTDEI